MKVWDAKSGEELFTLKGHNGNVLGVAFSPDGKRLASSSNEQTVKLWDTQSGLETLTVQGQGGQRAGGVVFTADGKRLALPKDNTVEVWDAQPRPQESTPDPSMR